MTHEEYLEQRPNGIDATQAELNSNYPRIFTRLDIDKAMQAGIRAGYRQAVNEIIGKDLKELEARA